MSYTKPKSHVQCLEAVSHLLFFQVSLDVDDVVKSELRLKLEKRISVCRSMRNVLYILYYFLILVGSTKAYELIDKATNAVKIYVHSDYKHLTLSNIIAFYNHDGDPNNQFDKIPIQVQQLIGGLGNYELDTGYLQCEPGLRLIYVQRVKNNRLKSLPAYEELLVNNFNDNLPNLITLFYLLESAHYASSMCARCDIVVTGRHLIADCTSSSSKNAALNINDFEQFEPKMKAAIDNVLKIKFPGKTIQDVVEHYRTLIHELKKEYDDRFMSTAYTLSSSKAIIKMGKESWWLSSNQEKN